MCGDSSSDLGAVEQDKVVITDDIGAVSLGGGAAFDTNGARDADLFAVDATLKCDFKVATAKVASHASQLDSVLFEEGPDRFRGAGFKGRDERFEAGIVTSVTADFGLTNDTTGSSAGTRFARRARSARSGGRRSGGFGRRVFSVSRCSHTLTEH